MAIPVILIAYAIAAWHTASRLSPTNDETFHMVSAAAVTRHHDYRVDPVDPPLTKRLGGHRHCGGTRHPV
jgi:hypothetical protein